MIRSVILLIACLLITPLSIGQSEVADNIVGSDHRIESRVLEETRQLQISLPASYSESAATYPVLYLLDGQQFFNHAVSLRTTFRQFDLTPEFIIVGINTGYPERYGHFGDGKEKFTEFLAAELIPYVKENYRVSDEKLLFGWQYAGGFGFNLMLEEKPAFDAYLLASPIPIWDEVDRLANVADLQTSLYFSVSPNEYQINHGTDKLDSVLTSHTIAGLDWRYGELQQEEHHSTGYPTLYHGIRHYYKYYREFHQEESLQKFLEQGGIPFARAYAAERARRYGFPPELSAWSRYTIIRTAIRANDYTHFQTFVNEFFSRDFIRNLGNRAYELADYYEANSNFSKALDIYEILLEASPESETLLRKMGNAHSNLGNGKEARRYLREADKRAVDSH